MDFEVVTGFDDDYLDNESCDESINKSNENFLRGFPIDIPVKYSRDFPNKGIRLSVINYKSPYQRVIVYLGLRNNCEERNLECIGDFLVKAKSGVRRYLSDKEVSELAAGSLEKMLHDKRIRIGAKKMIELGPIDCQTCKNLRY